jgi:hypothetical protein
MASIIERLRESRKNPSVLKLKILKIRGENPDIFIFIYEGQEDIPVYEEWLSRIANCPHFEAVAGNGKEQLLGFYTSLTKNADSLLRKVFFFVDRDFDSPFEQSNNLFELEAYSIENLICTEAVLESLLRDEFRRAGKVAERGKICKTFSDLHEKFNAISKDLNLGLFLARRCGINVSKKPERATEIAAIKVNEVDRAYGDISEIFSVEEEINLEKAIELSEEFENLPITLRQRGKYLLDFFRRWLRTLSDDLKAENPVLFESRDAALPGDPAAVTMRRLTSAAPIPVALSNFIAQKVIPN